MKSPHFAVKVLSLFLALTLAGPLNVATALAAKSPTRVKHKSPDEYIPGFRIKLDAEIRDKGGVVLARCYFKTGQDDAYVFVEMTNAGDDYQATLPAPWLNSGYVEYLFVAVNGEKKITRTEVFKMKEKKTREAKKWKEFNDVPENTIDRIQETYEQYEEVKKQLVDRYKDKLPKEQDAFENWEIDVKGELKETATRVRGFYDKMTLTEVPPSLRYGLLVDGIYTQTQIAGAGGAAAASSATGATVAGGVSAGSGGIGWGWITIGALAAAGGAAAASGALGSGDDGAIDVRDAQPRDFVGSYDGVDPGRSTSEYRATFTFNDGGTGSVSEVINGRSFNSRLNWSFNASTDVFSFGVPGGGSASGVVSGTTDDFTLTGTYANGAAATLRLTRR